MSLRVVIDSKYLIIRLDYLWEFEHLLFFRCLLTLLFYFLVFIVLALHGPKFAIIINDLWHALLLFVHRVLNFFMFALYYLIYFLRSYDFVLFLIIFYFQMVSRSIRATCQLINAVLFFCLFDHEYTTISADLYGSGIQ